jgi:outer membrane protein
MRGGWLTAMGLVGLALAGPAAAQSLEQTLVESYLNNPELAAGRARLRATDELVPQALAGWRPRLFLDGGYERLRGRASLQTGGNADTDRDTWSTALTLSQNVYSGGSTTASTSRAENLVRAERASLNALEQTILLDAIDAHTAVWRDQAVLDLALNNEQRLARQLRATRDRFEVGEVSRTDVAQAEARLSRGRADVEVAKAELAASTAFYRRVVGREPADVQQPLTLTALPPNVDQAFAIAQGNPNILRANFGVAAAADDVDVVFADLLPSVDLQARLRYVEEPTTTFDDQRDATVGVTVSVPLYQGGAEYARVRERRQELRRARHAQEDIYRRVQESVGASWDRLLAATAAIEAFRSEVRANSIALQGVQEEALVGARTVLDVLDAEQELFESQVALVRAQREEVLASYQLKSAIGELTVVDLALPVEPFAPDAYYSRVRNRLFGFDEGD